MITNVPLMVVPLIVYNLVLFGLLGDVSENLWADQISVVPLISGGIWIMTLGDVMITLGLMLLFIEILKATRVGIKSIFDHLLSTFVFIAYLVEFLLVQGASTAVFFLLMTMTLIDVLAGYTISVRAASRDVSLGGGGF